MATNGKQCGAVCLNELIDIDIYLVKAILRFLLVGEIINKM